MPATCLISKNLESAIAGAETFASDRISQIRTYRWLAQFPSGYTVRLTREDDILKHDDIIYFVNRGCLLFCWFRSFPDSDSSRNPHRKMHVESGRKHVSDLTANSCSIRISPENRPPNKKYGISSEDRAGYEKDEGITSGRKPQRRMTYPPTVLRISSCNNQTHSVLSTGIIYMI